MLARLGRFAVRRRRMILVAAVLGFVVAGAFGGNVAKHLSSGGFDNPGSEEARASRILEDQFHTGAPNLVAVVTARHGTVDDPAVAAAGRAVSRRLAGMAHVDDVASYWALGSPPPLRSKDKTKAIIAARVTGSQSDALNRVQGIEDHLRAQAPDAVTLGFGGFTAVFHEVNHTVEYDLTKAELIAVPITLILLILIFGSGVAALLPLAIGALSVVGTFLVLRLLSMGTEVSIFSLNLTTAMGLGLAIDYSLFIVTRYREELRAGNETRAAVIRTVRTAGRTVAFSALTVAASLSALLVFPLAFLRSFAYAGIAVAVIAGVSAVLVLPALLAVLGHRVNALTLWRRSVAPPEEGFWHRTALLVMRRPWPFVTGAVVLLVVLGLPFLGVKLGYPDDRVLPPNASTRQVDDTIRHQFASDEAGALQVVIPDLRTAGAPATQRAALDHYASTLSREPGIGRVDSKLGIYLKGQRIPASAPIAERFADPTGRGAWLSVVPTVEPLSQAGENVVHRIRATHAPFRTLVGGPSAQMVDSNAVMLGRLPIALGIIAVITFVLLFGSFGSIVMPLKALVLNVLSLSATFGAMVWIFQEGHLSGFLNFTPTGALDSTMPILMFCVAFGLSMDYEVFLLSRIKEEHDRGRSNELSVAHGLERTGRLVTAAALLMAVVFIAIATAQVTFIKMFGIGLTLAVLMDAFVIRCTLVPAFMRLAGNANWWAPGPLRRLYRRYGFGEPAEIDMEAAAPPAAPAVASAPGEAELVGSSRTG